MSWTPAQIDKTPAKKDSGIRATLLKRQSSPAKLSLTVSQIVAIELGWSDGDGIQVMIGAGEHHGLLRLRKNRSVGQVELAKRGTGKGPYFVVDLHHQSMFPDRSEPAQWCAWECVEDGWVQITLPKWAHDGRVSLVAAMGRGQTPAPRPKTAPKRGRDVTAALMGDPLPDRSAAGSSSGA